MKTIQKRIRLLFRPTSRTPLRGVERICKGADASLPCRQASLNAGKPVTGTSVRVNSNRIRKWTAALLSLVFLTGIAAIPCDAAEEAVIIARGEETAKSTEALTDEPEAPTDEAGTFTSNLKPMKLKHPASFQAEAVKNGIALSWKKVVHAQKYELYRKRKGTDDGYTLIRTTKKRTYTDKTAAYGVVYAYKVRAVAVSGKKIYKSRFSPVKACCTYRIDPSRPMVALTFDDGPSQYTAGILDTLEKYDSRATFFEVGNRVSQYTGTVLRISWMGCEIGNHSYDHAVLGNASGIKIQSEISKTDTRIKAITGEKPKLFRPPYGSIGSSLRKNAGKPMIQWSIDTLDWKSRNADTVYRAVVSQAKDGDIILMHDLYPSTRTAVAKIVPELQKRGYQLVTVSELARYKKIALSAGKSYSKMK